MTPGIIAFFTIVAVLLAFYAAFAPNRVVQEQVNLGTESQSGMFAKFVRPTLVSLMPATPIWLGRYAQTSPGVDGLLRRSGNPWGVTAEQFVLLRFLSAAGGATLLSLQTALGFLPIPAYLGFALGAVMGYIVPGALLGAAWGKRKKDLTRTLPEALDLLRISMNAGYNFSNALTQVVTLLPPGATNTELTTVLHDIRSGRTVDQALATFKERVPLDQVETFASAVSISNSMGTDMADTLAAQSGEARAQYERTVEQKAQKLQTTLFLPIIGMLLPSMLVMIFAPALSQLGNGML